MNGFKLFDNEDANLFLEKGLAIPSRTIYIGSESADKGDEEIGVDHKLAEKVIKSLHVLDSMGHDEIKVILNNVGGDEYHGMAIYDAIKQSKSPTRVTVYGQACSMGSVILQAGTWRVLAPSATVMVHMGDLEAFLDQRDIKAVTKEWERINQVVNDIYLVRLREKNRHYSPNQLKELLSTDRYLGAQETVDIGLADEVLT